MLHVKTPAQGVTPSATYAEEYNSLDLDLSRSDVRLDETCSLTAKGYGDAQTLSSKAQLRV